MTEHDERHRTCTGKQRYHTRSEAEAVLERVRKKWKLKEDGHTKLNAYHCPHCRFFHLGRIYEQ